ncbi:TPA: phage replisome organizer N-terminal domain-containing protein [Streptococcus agalactiae]|uniref:phage replisome organizer N-terminal domain-containing protein n=1 Tax=Peptoniphilus lacrimalis TaxID=33031 RepID=UPI0032C1A269
MADNRRYYWLKLKEDFFTDKRIKRLRKISGGDTYTIIYLKLLLLSLKDSGKLYYDGVETDFIKELALTIDETEDDVMVTVNYLMAQGLMEIITENDEYFLTEIPSLIGSETASTRRSRKSRGQKALQCNTNATHCNLLQQNCNGDIEKEIDIELEKEGEIEKISPVFYGEYKNVSLTDEEYGKLKDKMQGHREKMIEKLSTYMQSTGRNYKDHYATLIHWYEQDKGKLKECSKSTVYTLEDYDKGEHL